MARNVVDPDENAERCPNVDCALFRITLNVLELIFDMLDSPAILTLRFTCSTLAALVDDWWSKIVISSPRSFSHGFPDFKVVHDFVKERQDKIICVVWHLEVVRLIEFLTDIPKLTSLVITSPLKPTHLRLLREKCPFISTLHCQKIRPLQQSFWKALVEFAYLRRLSEFCLYTVLPSGNPNQRRCMISKNTVSGGELAVF